MNQDRMVPSAQIQLAQFPPGNDQCRSKICVGTLQVGHGVLVADCRAGSQLFFAAQRGNPDANLFPAHWTKSQDGPSLRLRSLPKGIKEEFHALPNGGVGRVRLHVRGVLPSRTADIDCD
jgi:hypothetical protein